ncbi:hypothetical protein CHU94_06075 [Rhodoferax sp. TH121]|uniref:hypothetical protein n=1 Tax=Rhodoferax sp. TH121 TaxID=2022803 RepID=UPI000B967EA8|nr:hypothetical protein [Rhodoferax sp. TH121]OYQ40711.1 hypothetical protein CHU94_06075 [Rhodoferax sp. TH121]
MNPFAVLVFIVCAVGTLPTHAQQTMTVNPKDIQISGYRHKELPASLLRRIKATTDTFEVVDGISYEKAVDLYKRDLDPEGNLVLWEEMVKGYKSFCASRCKAQEERMDVYRLLLLRSMFDDQESLKRANLKALKPSEAMAVVKLYRLPPKPIDVVKGQ